jgi:hypothetical protein
MVYLLEKTFFGCKYISCKSLLTRQSFLYFLSRTSHGKVDMIQIACMVIWYLYIIFNFKAINGFLLATCSI